MCLFEVWWNWDTPSLGPVQDVLKHPQLENTECGLRSGCPVVRKDHALALITEIEHMELGRARGEDQEVVGITISRNTGKNLELHEGSR